jgi:hypothetical protein
MNTINTLSEAIYDAGNLSHLHHTDESPYHRHTDELMATEGDKHRLSKDALKIAVMDYLIDNPHRSKAGLNFHVSELTGMPKHLVAIHNDLGYTQNRDGSPNLGSYKQAIQSLPSQLGVKFIAPSVHESNALNHTMNWWKEQSPFIRLAFDEQLNHLPEHKRSVVESGFNKRADLLDSMADKWTHTKDLGIVDEA